jgi:hypothetical protein
MLRPPVSIDALMEEWANDAVMNETEPARDLAKIPNLHAKYLNILTHHNLIVKKITADYNKLKSIKWQYYSGDLNNPEDLERYGLEPMPKKILRQDISIHIDSDPELTTILLKKMIHQEIVDYCTLVLKEINARTWQLQNIVKLLIFNAGN